MAKPIVITRALFLSASLLALLPLRSGATAGESEEVSRTFARLLPDGAGRLSSPDVAQRVSVARELTMPYADDVGGLKFRYSLSRGDYLTVLKAVFALDLRRLPAAEARQAWYAIGFIVTQQHLRELAPTLVPYLRAGTDRDRLQIAKALASLHDDAAVPEIVPLLQSSERGVRQETAGLLVAMQAPEVVPVLVAGLADPDPSRRFSAVRDLVRADARGATDDIAKLLDDPDEDLRYWAVDALFKLGPRPYVPAIRKLLTTDKNRNTVSYAVAVLAALGDPDAIEREIRALTTYDPLALDYTNLYKTHATPMIPAVIAALASAKPHGDYANDINSRSRLIGFIRRLGSPEARRAIPVLRSYLRPRQDAMLREAAADALADLRAGEAADDLAALVDPKLTKDGFTRCRSGVALARVGDPRSLPKLIALAADPKCGYRARIVAEMNASLDRGLWQRLEGTRVPGERPWPIEEAVDALRRQSGLAIELRSHRTPGSSDVPPFRAWDGAGGPAESALRDLEQLVERTGTPDRPFTFQFRGEVIAILPVDDAVDWWRQRSLVP